MTSVSAVAAIAGLACLVDVAEAAVLPLIGGLYGDGESTVGVQAGGWGALALDLVTALGAAKYADGSANLCDPEHWDITCEEYIYAGLFLLNIGLILIEFLELLNGFGSPNTGHDFLQGSTDFGGGISAILQRAAPIDWSGVGAEEYDRRNEAQQARVGKIAAADRRIAGLLEQQAAEVEQGRLGLGVTRLGVMGGLMVWQAGYALWLQCIEEARYPLAESIADSTAYAAFVCILAAVPAAVGVISALVDEGIRHENRISGAMNEGYRWVVEDANSTPAKSLAAVAVFEPSLASKFGSSAIGSAFAERLFATADQSEGVGEFADSGHGNIPPRWDR